MQIKELPLYEMGMNCSLHKVTKGSASTRHSAHEMENAKQMLTVNIQDEGKACNLSKTRGHQAQEETPTLRHKRTRSGDKNGKPICAILKLKVFKRRFSHDGLYSVLST